MERHRLARSAREVFLWVGATLGCVTLLFAASCWIFSVTPLIFTSGSMQPTYSTGDLGLAVEVDGGSIRAGDVVSVVNAEQHRVTHRVVTVVMDGEEAVLTLQGDDNDIPDQETYQVSHADRVVFGVPKVGSFIRWLSSPTGLFVTGGMAVIALYFLFGGHDPRGNGPSPTGGGRRKASRGGPVRDPDVLPAPRTVRRERILAMIAVVAVGLGVSTVPITGTAAAWTDTATAASGLLNSTNLKAPINIDCTGAGLGRPTFTWDPAPAPSAPATEYKVRYTKLSGVGGVADGESVRFASTSWQVPSSFVSLGATYKIEVMAFRTNWESSYAVAAERVRFSSVLGVTVSECIAAVIPAAPRLATCTTQNGNKPYTLGWTWGAAGSNPNGGFRVIYSVDPDNNRSTVYPAGARTGQTVDINNEAGTFRLVAIVDGVESPPSNAASYSGSGGKTCTVGN